jgi:transposase
MFARPDRKIIPGMVVYADFFVKRRKREGGGRREECEKNRIGYEKAREPPDSLHFLPPHSPLLTSLFFQRPIGG